MCMHYCFTLGAIKMGPEGQSLTNWVYRLKDLIRHLIKGAACPY